MRTLLGPALALCSCAVELPLPGRPDVRAPPVIADVMPGVAIASMGSAIMVDGEHLEGAKEVWLGPVRIPAEELQSTPRGLVFHVTSERLGALELDGAEQPLRVVTPAGSDTAHVTVRVFSGRTAIEEIAPADVTSGNLVYLRGSGFDGEELANNRVLLQGEGGECPVNPGESGKGCSEARVFWATRGLVIALVPEEVPDGPVRVVYENLAFRAMEEGMDAWMASGRAPSDFWATLPRELAPSDAEAAASMAAVPEMGSFASDRVTVWSDPGALTVSRVGAAVRLEGEGRLCYLAGGSPSPRFTVLLDGRAVRNDALSCSDAFPRRVEVNLGNLDGFAGARVSVQVKTPFHQSPTAWLE